jgi:hypothetical protein
MARFEGAGGGPAAARAAWAVVVWDRMARGDCGECRLPPTARGKALPRIPSFGKPYGGGWTLGEAEAALRFNWRSGEAVAAYVAAVAATPCAGRCDGGMSSAYAAAEGAALVPSL